MFRGVKPMGLETCGTLSTMEAHQAQGLRDADRRGSRLLQPPFRYVARVYGQVISTRTYQYPLDTLEHVRDVGINSCCRGIVRMSESRRERAGLISQLED
jgi:biotin synthase